MWIKAAKRVRGGAAEHARMHRARQRFHGDHDVGQAAQAGREAGRADREVACIAHEDGVGAQQVGVLRDEGFQPAGALLLGSLADDLDGDGESRLQCAQRGQVHRDVAFAVGRAPAVPAPVDLGQLPHRRGPGRVVQRWLHVVVEVQQHRRGPGWPRGVAADGDAAVGGVVAAHVLQARRGERREQPFDHAGALGGRELRRVVHGSERDHLRQIALGLWHKSFDLVAERFGGHAVFLPIGLGGAVLPLARSGPSGTLPIHA